MSGWPTKPLGEVCTINPKLAASDAPAPDAEVAFVPMAAVDEVAGSITRAVHRPYKEVAKGYTPFREGDVLFAKITPCMQNGKAAIARGLRGGLGFGSTEFHILRPSEGLLPEWVFALIRQPSFRSAAEATFTGTAGQQRVPADFLKAFPIPLPPLQEQERIVALLDEADELRKLRAQADRRTAALIPALFHEMFGDPAINPKGWKLTAISEMAEVQGGLQLTPLRNTYALKRPYLRVANVQRGFLVLDEMKEIGLLEAEYERTKLANGDLLLVEGNGNPKEVGRAAIWDGSIENCVHQNHLIRVRPITELLTSNYLLAFVNSESGRSYFHGAGNTTSGLSTITTGIVKGCRIPVPPLPLQKEFAERVTEIRSLEAAQSASRRRSEDLFQAMLHSAFSGDL